MKKFFKIAGLGCAGLIGLFIVLGIIGAIFSDETKTEIIDSNSNSIVKDSSEIKKQIRIKDSINLINQEKKDKAKIALKKFENTVDEFENTIFYNDPRTPNFINVNFIYPYIGQKGENYWLRLKLQYTSNDWLFIKEAVFLVDDEKFTLTGSWKKDNDSRIWEWLDINVGNSEYLLLKKIANSKTAKVRYVGMQYYKDRIITRKEKSIIKRTLDTYDGLILQ
jgi:hypothetical protein